MPVTEAANGLDIIELVVDLTATHALFDTDEHPNTPGSGPGLVGGQFFPGQVYNVHYPTHSLTSVWGDPINHGDLFLVSTKIFEPNLLQANGPGLNWSAGWSQDLDVWSDDAAGTPEPGTLGVTALVLSGLCAIRRNARARSSV
ncbi:MAG TPA: PEP-CTERM sorting domain-containing protein [Candidatus Acidoferrum sp.]|nr:PEP-CTERM sorting domain-containing protein [Candidatus Acidoferrum sp.]